MQVESCSKFWFQPKIEKQIVQHFNRELNNPNTSIIERCTDLASAKQSDIIAARNKNDDRLYRGRLISWDYDAFTKSYKATVCFIDYGHTQQCDLRDLYTFTMETEESTLPPRCFQCRLAEVQPSSGNISGGFKWDNEAIESFKTFVLDRDVKAQVIISNRFLF